MTTCTKRWTNLKHGEQKVLFSTIVLISVDGEHDRLQELIDFGHGDEAAEMRNMPGLGLEQKQKVAVLLRPLVVGK